MTVRRETPAPLPRSHAARFGGPSLAIGLLASAAICACGPRPGASPAAEVPAAACSPGEDERPTFTPQAFASFWQLGPPAVDAKVAGEHLIVFLHVAPDLDDAALERRLMQTVVRTVEHFGFRCVQETFVDIGIQTLRGGQKAYKVWLMPVAELVRFERGELAFEALVERFDFRQKP